MTTPKPVSLLPGVPPIGDTVPGYAASSWYAIMAPAGTPREVVVRLDTEINRILAKPQVQERWRSFGTEPAGDPPPSPARAVVGALPGLPYRSGTTRLSSLMR